MRRIAALEAEGRSFAGDWGGTARTAPSRLERRVEEEAASAGQPTRPPGQVRAAGGPGTRATRCDRPPIPTARFNRAIEKRQGFDLAERPLRVAEHQRATIAA